MVRSLPANVCLLLPRKGFDVEWLYQLILAER